MEDLQSEIHRYSFQDIKKIIVDIERDMRNEKEKSNLYTLSLVKTSQLHKLANINITNKQELKNFYNRYYQNKEFSEIWVCKKSKNKERMFSVGRISFDTRDQSNSSDFQTIEQVWNVSHRDIESYTTKYEKAYIRAYRITWGRRYSIKNLNVPKDNQLNKEQMISQFMQVVKEIENRRENIENFEEYLKKLGIDQFSLEYLLQEGKFLFIDWDSQNDLKVINQINREEEKNERIR